MKIPHRALTPSEPMAAQVAWAREQLAATQKPVALIVPGGVLE